MIGAVIPAAGTGTRFRAREDDLPKQYRTLDGAPIYMWSLTIMCKHPNIEHVVLAVAPDMVKTTESSLLKIDRAHRDKVSVIAGGKTRQQSVRLGIEKLAELPEEPNYVIVHDAARPFLTYDMLSATIKCVTEYGACTLAVPVTDTIKRATDMVIEETLDRDSLYLIQTPQAGRFDWLLAAHRQAFDEGFETTDDAAILEYAGHKVSIVSGSRYNLKITNPEDLHMAQAIAPIVLGARSRDEE
ncbi:MAG TPA: 2-C-methyl-D-erythritol 4-phosphate cytidylyltransferase [Planktothrix sp.]|jgi:2-C-methyl-D-erythritol 4-phosphate cytidylyltransferase